jgi:hypothetical protein
MFIVPSKIYKIHMDMGMIDIQCAFCKNNFSSQWAPSWNRPSPKYCSQRCMSEGFERKANNVCETCKKEFVTRPSETRKYCCLKCFKRPTSYPNRKKQYSFWATANEEEKISRYKEMFDRKVIKRDGCWGWRNPAGSSGYGYLGPNGYVVNAHRLSWIIHNGPIPENLWVLHKCNNPICSNPDHLYLGTPKDNTRDMILAGRSNRNMQSSKNAKLTLEQAKEIKILLATTDLSQYEIAKKFNVGRGTVQDIKRNKMWRNA